MPETVTPHSPDDAPLAPRDAHDTIKPPGAWTGPTYYGRPQLKPAPFENWVVGGYVFLAGLSGASALITAIADAKRGPEAANVVRRGRYLSLLAPTIGSGLLVWDLYSPKRFYNMFRIAKSTSPMSIGTWTLTAFSAFAGIGAASQFLADRISWLRWLRGPAKIVHVPAAIAGAGISTYTSALLSATSTPLWAAAPEAMAVRFGASSVASGASALSLGEPSPSIRRALSAISVAALVTELAATAASHDAYERTGVAEALDRGWGQVERQGATDLGVMAPLVMQMASLTLSRRPGTLSTLAAVAGLAGSLLLRVSIMGAGDTSAERPEISFRFSQPRNLPRRERRQRLQRRPAGVLSR